jgi:hypothetical protein
MACQGGRVPRPASRLAALTGHRRPGAGLAVQVRGMEAIASLLTIVRCRRGLALGQRSDEDRDAVPNCVVELALKPVSCGCADPAFLNDFPRFGAVHEL